jgi:adenylate cyclase
MKVEIERKFLVRPALVPASVLGAAGQRFTQGYLSSRPSVRVRLDHSGEAWLTIKSETLRAAEPEPEASSEAPSRHEYEYAIPADDARGLLTLCLATLDKVRRRVPVGASVWELDEFLGPHAGLWMAEIELSRPDEGFVRPAWITDEVSDDPRYTNGALAKAGRPPAASRPAIARALALLGDRLARLDGGRRLAAIAPLMEAASLMAVADGEVDDDERDAIHKILQKLSVDALSAVVADAMLARSVEQTRELGVDRRAQELARALVKHGVVREGIFIAALVAEVSGGTVPAERALLERLAALTDTPSATLDEATTAVHVALGR